MWTWLIAHAHAQPAIIQPPLGPDALSQAPQFVQDAIGAMVRMYSWGLILAVVGAVLICRRRDLVSVAAGIGGAVIGGFMMGKAMQLIPYPMGMILYQLVHHPDMYTFGTRVMMALAPCVIVAAIIKAVWVRVGNKRHRNRNPRVISPGV